MDIAEIVQRLQSVFHDVFDDDSIVLTENTSAANIEGWDSLANVRLLVSIERAFGLRFNVGEFQEYRNVGDLISGISRRVT